MNAVERIEAAIQKLEALKAESTQGEWRQPRMLLGIPTTSIFSGSEVVGYAGMQDGDLIVTLHRTIDAQLAILRHVDRHYQGDVGVGINRHVVALADAVLGVSDADS